MDTTQATEAINDCASRASARVSRHTIDKALLTAQTYGYYGIDLTGGQRINVTFTDDGFDVRMQGE